MGRPAFIPLSLRRSLPSLSFLRSIFFNGFRTQACCRNSGGGLRLSGQKQLVARASIASKPSMAQQPEIAAITDGKHLDQGRIDSSEHGRDDGQPDQELAQPPEDFTVEEVERVYRKIDWRIIPAFWVLYFLCSAIRSNIGIAQTMNQDQGHDLMTVLNLTPKDTSLALALFYVAYVIFDFPSNLIMSKLSPRVWMARIVIAGMWPGMAYYLTLFYPPSRTGKRIGMYFSAA